MDLLQEQGRRINWPLDGNRMPLSTASKVGNAAAVMLSAGLLVTVLCKPSVTHKIIQMSNAIMYYPHHQHLDFVG